MRNRGFSILEVLISVTILSFIMVGIISVTGDSTTTKERIIAEDKENLQVEMALARFDWDFSQIYSPMYFSNKYVKPFTAPGQTNDSSKQSAADVLSRFSSNKRFPFPNQDGLPVPKFQLSDKTTFVFMTTSNRRKVENSKQSHFGWVKYAIESPRDKDSEKKGDNLVRYFLAVDPFKPDELSWDDVKGHILMEGITSLKFEFWDREKKKFVDSLTQLEGGEHKIWGVKISIEWVDATEIEREDIRIFRTMWPYFKPEDLNKMAQEEYSKQKKTASPTNTPKTTSTTSGGSN